MRIPEFIFLTISVFLCAFVCESANQLKTGDLIFQLEGKSDFSKAISGATSLNDSASFVHVGIIEVTNEEVMVIEADPEAGVRCINLEEFIGNGNENTDRYIVKRLDIGYPSDIAIQNAKSFIGQPYDWWYMPDNGKMYCSELVYESYVTEDGHKIFPASPMNFKAADGSIPSFWVKLFEELGEPVPQGVLGTNPNDMAADPRLSFVLTLP